MSDESRRILDLLAQGKITVDEADQLLRAIGQTPPEAEEKRERTERKKTWGGIFGVGAVKVPPGETPGVRYLKIEVNKSGAEGGPEKRVNLKVPIALVRGGMRLGAIVGCGDHDVLRRLRDRGIDLDLSKIDEAAIADLLENLGELTVDVDKGASQVRITCE